MPRHLAASAGARPALTIPAGATYGFIPGGVGISLSGAASTTFSTVTAAALGVAGAAPRSLFLEFVHKGDGNNTTQWLWGVGIASTVNQLFGVMMNLFGSHMLINCYGSGDFFFNVKPTTDDAIVRLAVTYDPDAAGGTLTYYYRTLPLAGGSAGIWSQGTGTKTGVVLATASSGPTTLGYRQDGNSPATTAQIAYILSVGGTCWTPEEAWDAVHHPERLWRRPVPISLAPNGALATLQATIAAVAGADTLAAALAARVAAAGTLAPGPDAMAAALAVRLAAGAGLTAAPDSLIAALAARITGNAALAGLTDTVAASLSARIGVAVVASPGPDTVVAALAARIGASGNLQGDQDILSGSLVLLVPDTGGRLVMIVIT